MKNLSLHILDLVQNSIQANATKIQITINESKIENIYKIEIKDNGVGMSEPFLQKVTDSYTTTRINRKVGLGIPLVKMNAELSNGSFKIASKEGQGTVLTANFEHTNINRPPIGDIASTISLMVIMNKEIEFVYTHSTDEGKYVFETKNTNNNKINSLTELIQKSIELINYSR